MMEKATFGAGCFWGVEEYFRTLEGVSKTDAGYCGGEQEKPTYKEVCAATTGHAEVVQIHFDPTKISYETLVEKFFQMHNPTTLNRQGADVGTQYRSVIFFHSDEQKATAQKVKKTIDNSGKFSTPVVTQIVSELPFWEAEEHHQKYFMKRGGGTCHI